MDGEIIIEELGGNCPVQAEGTIDGKRFYFRARGDAWSIQIHPTSTNTFTFWPDDRKEWFYRESYGDSLFAAGWMTEEEAREFITKAADIYRKQK